MRTEQSKTSCEREARIGQQVKRISITDALSTIEALAAQIEPDARIDLIIKVIDVLQPNWIPTGTDDLIVLALSLLVVVLKGVSGYHVKGVEPRVWHHEQRCRCADHPLPGAA